MKTRFLLLFIVFLNSTELIFAQVPSWKQQTATAVFEDIVYAYGSGSTPPSFEITPGKKNLVMYYPGQQSKIIMDEYVYDLCSGFGSDSLNALAALIGHELAHYYEKHNWCSSFGHLLGEETELSKSISKVQKEQKLFVETQADFYGGFYGHVAGYATYAITSKLLDEIYKKYNLPEEIKGYPSKTERKTIATESFLELYEWTQVFDLGEFLFALKEYDQASICFDYLSNKFPSREMFNNAGVCRVFAALEYTNAEQVPFMLPVEFDPVTRLRDGTLRDRGTSDTNKEKAKNKLLREALDCFENAIERDPNYINAKINMGCTYLLLENSSMADGIANDIIILSDNETSKYDLAKACTLKAIAAWMNNSTQDAKKQFMRSNQYYQSDATIYNLEALDSLSTKKFDKFMDYLYSFIYSNDKKSEYGVEKAFNPSSERIGNLNASGITMTKATKTVTIPGSSNLQIAYYPGKDYHVIRLNNETRQYIFIQTSSDYRNPTNQGVRLNNTSSLVKQRYGEPTYVINIVQGKYLVYRKTRMIFLIDHQDKVKKWILFDKS